MFDNGVQLDPTKSVIQAWKANDLPAVTAAGLRATNSYKWYLNHGCSNDGDGTWDDFYVNDPLRWLPGKGVTPAQKRLVLGGETTMVCLVDGWLAERALHCPPPPSLPSALPCPLATP